MTKNIYKWKTRWSDNDKLKRKDWYRLKTINRNENCVDDKKTNSTEQSSQNIL